MLDQIKPPFDKGQKVECLRDSTERRWTGSPINNCRCSKGTEYTIDGCVWSSQFGWLISITGELHDANDFQVVSKDTANSSVDQTVAEERLFKASEYREAEAEHKRKNPTRGDYWVCDFCCPFLVVISVAAKFVTVCKKTKPVCKDRWTWDLNFPEIISKLDFEQMLQQCHVAGNHQWVVKFFEFGCEQSISTIENRGEAPRD